MTITGILNNDSSNWRHRQYRLPLIDLLYMEGARLRHTYRPWLYDTGAPMGAQQKLMRHAQISTTLNVYGNALKEAKRRQTQQSLAGF
jgi:integrase